MNPCRKTNPTRDVVISRHELQEIIRHELRSVSAELMGSGIDAGVTNNPLRVFNAVPVSTVIDRLEKSNQIITQSIIDRLRLKLPLQDQSEGTSATAAATVAPAAAAAVADDEDCSETAAVKYDQEDIGNSNNDEDDNTGALVPASAACAGANAAQSASTTSSTDTCDTSGASVSSGSSIGNDRKRKSRDRDASASASSRSSIGNERSRKSRDHAAGTHQHDAEVWEVLNALPPEEREKQRKYLSLVLSREVRSLQSHNQPGLHGIGVDQETDITLRIGRPLITRSGYQGVIQRLWDDNCNDGTSHPILFTRKPNNFPPQFISDVFQMKEEIIDFSRQRTRKMRNIKGLEQVMLGYFKGHIPSDVANRTGFLPGNLQVKSNADQKGIIFYNTEAGQCVTHWDRDTSLLILLAGKKTVMIASPGPTTCNTASTESNSSLYDDIDPFVKGKEGHWSWHSVDLKPNDALLIPKQFLHAVQSEKDTVAISLQVETYNDPKRYRDREKELKEEEKQLEEALRLSREEADKKVSAWCPSYTYTYR